ncbi:galactose-1-phosphate uridylyltransferase [Amycolatopsis panacis]|uniref:Galactose-1-phosphate uridylyltransferase n=1 Tax=Amycolatopsis panacis TaxID=2340917 RepID=A0A419I6N7_9PSEU|nr:galactose-1-phosphate uridylyltransferase [Amycolatopsis panacis]RJQ87235.1 galactose-1-phosphate uridylyltransferase [Amycolatopsis panacis]
MTTHTWHGGQLRWNSEARAWSVLAPGRRDRPHVGRAGCPFCPGPGEDTPPETWRLSEGADWLVRAVPNRYALSDHHEIVIESPRHDWDIPTGTVAETAAVLSAWQVRHRALRAGAAQVAVFRNHGAAAGVSLTHPHSQVTGLPVLADSARRDLETAREHHAATGRRFAEDVLTAELSAGRRIVFTDEQIVAFSPFASTADYEVAFLPRALDADFATAPRETIDALAHSLRVVLSALRAELGDPAYNLVVRTAPTGYEDAPFAAWSLRLLPRLTIAAGLELATGIPVITVPPETAAARLRTHVSPTVAS